MPDEFRISLDTAANVTLDDWIHDIRIVWTRPDAKRSVYDALLHTVNHASKLGEQVRRGEFSNVLNEVGDTVMWFLTFVGKLQQQVRNRPKNSREERLFHVPLQLTEIGWNKYPYVCHACFSRLYKEGRQNESWKRKCDCLLTPRLVESRSDEEKSKTATALQEFAAQHIADRVSKLHEWEAMFDFIYEANYENLSLESIAFHLLEEVGEVSDALLRLYTYNLKKTPKPEAVYLERLRNLQGEIADVISWIFAVCLKIKRMYEIYDKLPKQVRREPFGRTFPEISRQISLPNVLWHRYGHPDNKSLYCPTCGNRICNCKLQFARSSRKVDTLLAAKEEAIISKESFQDQGNVKSFAE